MRKSLFYIKCLVIVVFLFCNSKHKAFAIPTGTPVYDITAAIHLVDLVKNTAAQIEYHKQMIENIGNGKFTPSSIYYLGNIYSACIGKRFVLPDFIPKINLNICNAGSTDQLGTFYTDKVLINKDDNEKTRQVKLQQLNTKRQQLRKTILTTSTAQIMYHAENNQKSIETLYSDLKEAKTEIALHKIQAQIQLKILEELQEVKINQALMMQSIGLNN